MYVLSYTVPVNPSSAEPKLNREQVWRGLEMKAKNALPFVPGMTNCEVIERHENVIVRDVTFASSSHREKILLHNPVRSHFDRVGENGFIENTISDSEQGVHLAITSGLNFPDTEPGSDTERAKGDAVNNSYVGEVAATLDLVCQFVQNGEV